MKLRPGLVTGGILIAALLTLFVGAAGATGTGAFSGAITPTTCGPMHDVPVVQGDTTIDAVAAEYVSANDSRSTSTARAARCWSTATR